MQKYGLYRGCDGGGVEMRPISDTDRQGYYLASEADAALKKEEDCNLEWRQSHGEISAKLHAAQARIAELEKALRFADLIIRPCGIGNPDCPCTNCSYLRARSL